MQTQQAEVQKHRHTGPRAVQELSFRSDRSSHEEAEAGKHEEDNQQDRSQAADNS